ncbi:DUF4160 domain-containing protein [Anatilimnocola sp. NA78]|uniref:DUF4160 domain-containing protein n=1 Tax=Anatilimnocola sp. NA78 TaxID=3415683 RepID=UPI003CE4614D
MIKLPLFTLGSMILPSQPIALFCERTMPEISRFRGISIRMYYRDHAPPHFHAAIGDHEILVEIDSGDIAGRFPKGSLVSVLEWYELHVAELQANWELARQELPLNSIAPLE